MLLSVVSQWHTVMSCYEDSWTLYTGVQVSYKQHLATSNLKQSVTSFIVFSSGKFYEIICFWLKCGAGIAQSV